MPDIGSRLRRWRALATGWAAPCSRSFNPWSPRYLARPARWRHLRQDLTEAAVYTRFDSPRAASARSSRAPLRLEGFRGVRVVTDRAPVSLSPFRRGFPWRAEHALLDLLPRGWGFSSRRGGASDTFVRYGRALTFGRLSAHRWGSSARILVVDERPRSDR